MEITSDKNSKNKNIQEFSSFGNQILEERLEKNKSIYCRYIEEIFNQGKLDLLPNFVSANFVLHESASKSGIDAIKQAVTMYRSAFPDLNIELLSVVAEGDKVCSRSVMRGTHRGVLFDKLATGRSIEVSGLTMVTILEGKLTESWVRNDIMGLMKQIGPKEF